MKAESGKRRPKLWRILCALVVVQMGVLPVSTRAVSQYSESIKIDANGATLPTGKNAEDTKAVSFTNGVTVNKTNLGMAKEVYLSIRTDAPPCANSLCGSGTRLDPYDASTRAKLDAAWPVIEAAAPKTVTFLPSTTVYVTQTALRLFSNVRIVGYGATIRADTGLATTVNNTHVFKRLSSDGAVNDSTVEGFTIDCNNAGQTYANSAVGAIKAFGSRNKALNNKVINAGSKGTGAECFVIGYLNTATIAGIDNEIAGNDITSIGASNGGVTIIGITGDDAGITSAVNPDSSWIFGGKIHDNVIHDITAAVGGTISGTGLGSYSVGQEIYKNTFRNLNGFAGCIYTDTGSSFGAKIHDNIATNVDVFIKLSPVQGTGQTVTDMTIENNTAFITPGNPAYALNAYGGPFIRANITGNHFYRYGASGTCNLGINVANFQQSVITGNIVGPNFNSTSNAVSTYTDLHVSNNTFDSLVIGAGGTNLTSASNHKNDGTRLALATDTDVYQGSPATVTDLTVTRSASGTGSGLTGVHVDANNVAVTRRAINDANYTWQPPPSP